jgi:hypothetical protein
LARSKVNEQNIPAREREVKALDLRRDGKSYQQIADELCISKSGAQKLVVRAYNRSLKIANETAEFNRKLDLERLDLALVQVMNQIAAGELKAVDRLVAITDRRAKLLGLDAPTKIAPTDPTGTMPYAGLSDAEIEREIASVLAGLGVRAQVPLEPARPAEPEAAAG